MQGYHQQELEEHCKQYTAFNAGPIGFFEYNRLPFGITNASASFQMGMAMGSPHSMFTLEPLIL